MTRIRIAGIALLFLFFASFGYAQEPNEEPKKSQQEESKPEANRDAAPPAHHNDMKPPKQDEAKPPKQERQENAKPEHNEARPNNEHRGQQAQEQRGQQNQGRAGRPAGKSAHIPDEKFRTSFGRQHTFVVNRPQVVNGQPSFQYGGYWFEIVDPWPAEWLYTDDVYVDYIDGDYFLFDVLHPGLRIAVFVVE
jgi:hypothetical protein